MLEAQELFPTREGGAWGFEDIAVLYRTHRQAALLEECLQREGIPYVVMGRENFLQTESVRGAVCFFKALLQPEDKLAAQTAKALLWKGDTGDSFQTMTEKYLPLLKRRKPQKLLEEWIKDWGMEESKELQKLSLLAVFYQKTPDFLDALETGVESDLKRCGGKRYEAGAVKLMTFHGSKGLEFPVVLLYGVRKGLVPFAGGRDPTDAEEERRLFYVGLTRARETLILTSSQEPSAFWDEIPQSLASREKISIGKSRENAKQMNLFEL